MGHLGATGQSCHLVPGKPAVTLLWCAVLTDPGHTGRLQSPLCQDQTEASHVGVHGWASLAVQWVITQHLTAGVREHFRRRTVPSDFTGGSGADCPGCTLWGQGPGGEEPAHRQDWSGGRPCWPCPAAPRPQRPAPSPVSFHGSAPPNCGLERGHSPAQNREPQRQGSPHTGLPALRQGGFFSHPGG